MNKRNLERYKNTIEEIIMENCSKSCGKCPFGKSISKGSTIELSDCTLYLLHKTVIKTAIDKMGRENNE